MIMQQSLTTGLDSDSVPSPALSPFAPSQSSASSLTALLTQCLCLWPRRLFLSSSLLLSHTLPAALFRLFYLWK